MRAALNHTNKVVFACDGTIVLSNTISIDAKTILDASGHRVTISGNNAVQVFNVLGNGDLTLSNLVIADGRVVGAAAPPNSNAAGESASGGAVVNQGVLNLVNCTFTNNSAVGGAGCDGYYNLGAVGRPAVAEPEALFGIPA